MYSVCFDLTTFVVSRYCVIGEIILETGAQHRQSRELFLVQGLTFCSAVTASL